MLAAALLAWLWAQAEQAPVPPAAAPAPAPAAQSGAPTPAPVAPAGAASVPPPQAAAPAPAPQAAAPAPAPQAAAPAPLPPASAVSVHLRYAHRLGSEGGSFVPTAGMSLGGEFERRLLAFESGIELGAALDFFYDRFAKDVVVATGAEPTIASRTLSQTSFVLMETTAWRYADTRLFAGIGGGVTIGYFAFADVSSNTRTELQLLARAVLGLDFAITPTMAAVLRVDYNRNFGNDTFVATPSGTSQPLFGDIFNAGVGLLLRF